MSISVCGQQLHFKVYIGVHVIVSVCSRHEYGFIQVIIKFSELCISATQAVKSAFENVCSGMPDVFYDVVRTLK